MAANNWQELMNKYLDNTISREEFNELLRKAGEQEDAAQLTAALKTHWNKAGENQQPAQPDWEAGFAGIINTAETDNALLRKKSLGRWYTLAAAAIAGIVLLAGYRLLLPSGVYHPAAAIQPVFAKDIAAPSGSNAILTLADGKTIVLDSASNGALALQGDTKLSKSADGQIIYRGSGTAAMQYNTLTVPKGSRVTSITLTDGTKVWLNAGSSLRYPVAFAGSERKVSITGEAYFEVAHLAAAPFKVEKGAMELTVLGTHFNVNAYEDESSIRVTLLEGAVVIKQGVATGHLKPGQQASVAEGIKTFSDVNTEEAVAWMSGKFQFGEAADISSIMKQIARWYDADIEYRGVFTGHIGGTISRNENVSQVLKMLEMTGVVTFKIDGKKIIVLPG